MGPISILIFLAIVTTLWFLVATVKDNSFTQVFQTARYTPHQFFFVCCVFPLFSLFACTSIHIVTTKIAPKLPYTWQEQYLGPYWSTILFIAIILGGTTAAVEFFITGRSFDKLKPEMATMAHQLVDQLRAKESDITTDSEKQKDKKERRQSEQKFSEFEKNPSISGLKSLPERAKLRALLDRDLQLRLKLLTPDVSFASQLQVFVGATLFFMLFLCVGLILVHQLKSGPLDTEMISAMRQAKHLALAAMLLMLIHPACLGAYRSRIEPLTSPELPPGAAQFVAFFSILLIALIVLSEWKSVQGLQSVSLVLTGAGSIALYLLPKFKEGDIIHNLVGWNSNLGLSLATIIGLYIVSVGSYFMITK